MVLKKVITIRLPGKLVVPTAKPRGTPIREARKVATVEIERERKVMENTSRSRERIKIKASLNPSTIKSIKPLPKENIYFF